MSKRRNSFTTSTKPLFSGVDHGSYIKIEKEDLPLFSGRRDDSDRWIKPFLEVNRINFQALKMEPTIFTEKKSYIALLPKKRIGAIPVFSHETHKVIAGVLVKPRFSWAGLGALFQNIGFDIEPAIGDFPLVPGSAREVPPWLLAGPVIRKIWNYLSHMKRGFNTIFAQRSHPRGRIDWLRWIQKDFPSGRWNSFPCWFSEPGRDKIIIESIRGTLNTLKWQLHTVDRSLLSSHLTAQIDEILMMIGYGPQRPVYDIYSHLDTSWERELFETMSWVSEERGLGGDRILNGLSWYVSVDELWEKWVHRFVEKVAPRIGLFHISSNETRQHLNWFNGGTLEELIPDSGMRSENRIVWVDAKYKRLFQLIQHKGWKELSEEIKNNHRADIHQALAYAAVSDAERVDTILVYPVFTNEGKHPQMYNPRIASVSRGSKRINLLLAGLPFGFDSLDQEEAALSIWTKYLKNV